MKWPFFSVFNSHIVWLDDLFAFVIKMPIMHRLACLRDDVIFFIFLYQRFKYRTDYTRVNEYGQCVAPTEEMLKQVDENEEKDKVKSENVEITRYTAEGVVRRRGAREK